MLPEPRPAPQPRGPPLAAVCPPTRNITLAGKALTVKVMVTLASSSEQLPTHGALSCAGRDMPISVPPYIVATRLAPAGIICTLVTGLLSDGGTLVGSSGMAKVLAAPPGQSA